MRFHLHYCNQGFQRNYSGRYSDKSFRYNNNSNSTSITCSNDRRKLYAQVRLKRAQIYCISNRVINVSGSINCICFDKTGTLTEDGLDMWGIVPCTNGVLGEAERSIPKLNNHLLFEGMLTCHSLTLINGTLCGDPLDVKMFESTGWILEEFNNEHSNKYDLVAPTIVKPPKNNSFTQNMNEISEIGIVQQYQFSSSLQRNVCDSTRTGFRYVQSLHERITRNDT